MFKVNSILLLAIVALIACQRTSPDKRQANSTSKEIKSINNMLSFSAPETWRWISEDKSREFTMKVFKLTQDSLIAQYCAVYNGGAKLDCDFDENINIKAAYNKSEKVYVGNFKSFFNSEYGSCNIKLSGNSMFWKIIEAPVGTCYAPDQCVLSKIQNMKKENKPQSKSSLTNPTNFFPLDYNNFSKKVKMDTSTVKYVKDIFKQHYQMGVDASTEIPANGDYKLYLINNVSGDSDLIYLITIKGQSFIDGLEIANSNGGETQQTIFSIDKSYKISLFSYDGNKKKLVNLYWLNDKGKFILKN